MKIFQIYFIILTFLSYPLFGYNNPKYYSKAGLDYHDTVSLFDSVYQYTGQNISDIVDSLVTFKNYRLHSSIKSSGKILSKVLIDENGSIDAIYQISSLHNSLVDSLAIEMIKSSKFKPLCIDSVATKYYFVIDYSFKDRTSLSAEINGYQLVSELYNNKLSLKWKKNEDYVNQDTGSISLSTYNWNWPPYINSIVKKINDNLRPPVGIFGFKKYHGYTTVKFEISRAGELMNLEVLDEKGHKKVRESSLNVIKSIFPFKPLPDDFPDKKLVVTTKLIYPES